MAGKKIAHGGDRNLGGTLERKSVDASADRGEGDRLQSMLSGDLKRASVAGGKQFIFIRRAAVPDRPHGVDDVLGRESVARRESGLAGGTAAQGPAFLKKLRPCGPMDGAVDTAATRKLLVGGIDDGIDRKGGDVCFENLHTLGHRRVFRPDQKWFIKSQRPSLASA